MFRAKRKRKLSRSDEPRFDDDAPRSSKRNAARNRRRGRRSTSLFGHLAYWMFVFGLWGAIGGGGLV
ncbi:MAG: hypothetical protein HYZ60_08525, partial [Methylocystis sp.]|nr:hypothetical protein [Methylocystis sp.]